MLFQSKVNEVISNTYQEWIDQNNVARKSEVIKRLDYYRSNQAEYIAEELAKHFANPEKLSPVFINIVRKIIDNLALTYCKPAKREVDGTEKDIGLFKEITKSALFDTAMKQASKLTKLLKTILIRPVWRNDRLELDILTGDILDVETGDSPRDLRKVMITHYPASNKIEEVTYSLWTPDTWQRLDYRMHVIEEKPNPYKRIPFIAMHDSMPIDSFWIEGGKDLVSAQEAINERLTDLCYTLRHQAFGVGYIKSSNYGPEGIGDISTLDIGPGTLVTLPTDPHAEIGFASTNMPIEGIIQAIEFIINETAIANSLSAHSLTAKPVNESGISKIVSNSELQEKRIDDIALFRSYEHALFDLIKTVWNAHNPGNRFSDKAVLNIDFAEIKQAEQEMDEAEKWEQLITMGQASMVWTLLCTETRI